MSEPQETKDQAALPENAPPKKPYEKPQIVYRAPLEAVASVCLPHPPGKAIAGIGGCTTVSS